MKFLTLCRIQKLESGTVLLASGSVVSPGGIEPGATGVTVLIGDNERALALRFSVLLALPVLPVCAGMSGAYLAHQKKNLPLPKSYSGKHA